MSRDRAFVYAVCGGASHIKTLHRSLEYLRPRTAVPIVVVTDSRRNEIPVDHPSVIDVETPSHFSHHQASIFLKTSLHRTLPAGPDYAYLDSDVLAVDNRTDLIFEHRHGPVTFAKDITFAEQRVSVFSPWAVNCSCPRDRGVSCVHLPQAIERKFGVRVPADWVNWNGGVFLFGPDAGRFLDTWHSFTMQIFEDPYWKTRDQGTLIATVWKLGLQCQKCLPLEFNFILDDNNQYLRFDRKTGYALHESLPGIRPSFLHLYHANLDRPGWTLERDVEDALERRNQDKIDAQRRHDRTRSLAVNTRRLAKEAAPCNDAALPAGLRVIVGRPEWSLSGESVFSGTLVRSLRKRGIDAQVLLTEVDTVRASCDDPILPRPGDLPFDVLPVAREASWGARWGTLVRYLEERAPCVYVPARDWRNANVTAHLSDRVMVVGIVRGDDPRHYDQVERLGRYWNAIVPGSREIAARLLKTRPELALRIVEIRPGVDIDGIPAEPAARPDDGVFRIFYHGRLSDRRKRIFDLPSIVEAMLRRGTPVQLTIAGDGPDWGPLMGACDSLMKSGAVRWLGALPHERVIEELQRQDVWLMTAGSEGLPQAAAEAMACRSVPVVGDTPGISEFILDGINGFRVPSNDFEGFLDRLETLYRDSRLRSHLSAAAHRSVREMRLLSEDMAEAYVALFHRVLAEASRGDFRRPDGFLHPPPYQVDGTEVFPVRYFRGIDKVGIFPSFREDYEDYRQTIGEPHCRKFPVWKKSLVRTYPVILASSATNTRFVAALAEGLRRLDRPVQVLTPPGAPIDWIKPGEGVTIVPAPAGKAPWRPRYQPLADLIEQQAPCLYVPGDEAHHWSVCPHLSDRIGVIGRVDALEPQALARAAEMGKYCNAIVTESPEVARELMKLNSALCPRMITIAFSSNLPEPLPGRPREWEEPLKVAYWNQVDPPWPADTLERVATILANADVPVELMMADTDTGAGVFEKSDVCVLLSESEGGRERVVGAMGRGCVPLVRRGSGVLAEFIQDGENGYILPDGNLDFLAGRLRALQMSPLVHRLLSVGASKTAGFLNSIEGLADRYAILFQRVLEEIDSGSFRRRREP